MLNKFERNDCTATSHNAGIKKNNEKSLERMVHLTFKKSGLLLAGALLAFASCKQENITAPEQEDGSVASHKATMSSTPLKWSAPTLTNPITKDLGTGQTTTSLDTTKDYIINLPSVVKNGATTIIGGRNIKIVGGHITVPFNSTMKRALYIKDAVGTVHIEGVLISNPDSTETDGIVIAAPKAIVQIQNTRVEGLKGWSQSYHADLIQPWGGVKELRIDKFTGYSGYQGIQFSNLTGPVGKIFFSNINLESIDKQVWESGSTKGSNGGFLMWAECSFTATGTVENVYLKARNDRSQTSVVWPNSTTSCASTIAANQQTITWPFPGITGYFTVGRPANGDYVPVGVAGLSYQQ